MGTYTWNMSPLSFLMAAILVVAAESGNYIYMETHLLNLRDKWTLMLYNEKMANSEMYKKGIKLFAKKVFDEDSAIRDAIQTEDFVRFAKVQVQGKSYMDAVSKLTLNPQGCLTNEIMNRIADKLQRAENNVNLNVHFFYDAEVHGFPEATLAE